MKHEAWSASVHWRDSHVHAQPCIVCSIGREERRWGFSKASTRLRPGLSTGIHRTRSPRRTGSRSRRFHSRRRPYPHPRRSGNPSSHPHHAAPRSRPARRTYTEASVGPAACFVSIGAQLFVRSFVCSEGGEDGGEWVGGGGAAAAAAAAVVAVEEEHESMVVLERTLSAIAVV